MPIHSADQACSADHQRLAQLSAPPAPLRGRLHRINEAGKLKTVEACWIIGALMKSQRVKNGWREKRDPDRLENGGGMGGARVVFDYILRS